ncbi:dienelactone hydrolase family protein [Burkholderiaceae bacterium DAT-1]|nr:dienelactone hydrolase family protein [Burkholderiaceae bacterium DAT-1]
MGFRVIQQYDHSRAFGFQYDPVTGARNEKPSARPLQTLMWYPATEQGKRVRYGDYLATRLTEIEFDLGKDQLSGASSAQMDRLRRRLGEGADRLVQAERLARRDAPAIKGQFPVVIYVPGVGGVADENADLFEYLASYGYIVLSSTSLGNADKEIDESMAGVLPQLRDVGFLIGYAQSLPQADPKQIAVMGWSWGGMVNVFAAAQDRRIGALVSLDGTREPALTRQIDVTHLTAPWLYISRSPDTIPQINRAEIDTTFSLLNEAKFAHVYQLIQYPMQHVDFVSRRLHESSAASYSEYARSEIVDAYALMARYVRHFLDAYLRRDAEGQAFLKRMPHENGAPAHAARLERNLSDTQPVSRETYAAQLALHGFARAGEVYRSMQKQDPKFTLNGMVWSTWWERLIDAGRHCDALEILRFWNELEPDNEQAKAQLSRARAAAEGVSPSHQACK